MSVCSFGMNNNNLLTIELGTIIISVIKYTVHRYRYSRVEKIGWLFFIEMFIEIVRGLS